MSVRTIYTCERCKNERDTDSAFYTVGIMVETGAHDFNEYGRTSKRCVMGKQMQVCHACLSSMGINNWEKESERQADPPLTVEELIREIAREEITNVTGAA